MNPKPRPQPLAFSPLSTLLTRTGFGLLALGMMTAGAVMPARAAQSGSSSPAATPLQATSTSQPAKPTVGISPWGEHDELGRLNLMTEQSRASVLQRVRGGEVYDLSVEYFIGMPSWHGIGDPRYQFWLTHTPRGTAVDDPLHVGHQQNALVSYTGDAVSMYTHMGTHIDALNHFGLNGKIWNGFEADRYLGDKGWLKTGAETIPPIIARGVLIDLPAALKLAQLPALFRVERKHIELALKQQRLTLQRGDVVLLRTGRMQQYDNADAFMKDPPGLGMDAARFLVDAGAMIIGADNLSLETFPPEQPGNYVPVHTFLLAEHGIPILELAYLETLARDRVYEFAFIGGSLKFRGASAAPLRPIALPLHRN